MKVGDVVRVFTTGTLVELDVDTVDGQPRVHEPACKVRLVDDTKVKRDVWFSTREIIGKHNIAEGTWRDACADMIRIGRDHEAIAEFVANAPHAVPYIKALEAFFVCFKANSGDSIYMAKPGVEASDAWHKIWRIQNREDTGERLLDWQPGDLCWVDGNGSTPYVVVGIHKKWDARIAVVEENSYPVSALYIERHKLGRRSRS